MRTKARLFSIIPLALVAANCCEVPYGEPGEDSTNMALDTNFIPQTPNPNSLVPGHADSKVYEVAAATPTNKNDADFNNTVIETQVFTLADVKVAKAGDTMTDSLIVNASTPNSAAIYATGDGTEFGIRSTGGATGGGGRFVAGGGSNVGVSAVGDGTGSGIIATGGATGGPGAELYNGIAPTALVPQMGLYVQGLVRFDGVPPNAGVDPGFDNAVGKQNIVSASALVSSDGAGNFAVNAAGFNVATFAGTVAGVGTITFARALPGNNYRMHVYAQDTGGGFFDVRWNGVQNPGNFQFIVRDGATNAVVDLTITAMTLSVTVVGY